MKKMSMGELWTHENKTVYSMDVIAELIAEYSEHRQYGRYMLAQECLDKVMNHVHATRQACSEVVDHIDEVRRKQLAQVR